MVRKKDSDSKPPKPPNGENSGDGFIESQDGTAIAVLTAGTPITEADIIAAYEIDTAVWVPVRFIPNCWDVTTKKGDTYRNYSGKLIFERNKEYDDSAFILNHFIETASKYAKPFPKVKHTFKASGCLLEIDLFDAHIEKLAWAESTGYDCSLEKTCEYYRKSILDILDLAKGFDIGQILFPIGNDFFNADDNKGRTTAGTQQEISAIWQRAYRAGQDLLVESIELLRQVAPVDVLVVTGNHDRQRMFYVGEALRLGYSKTDDVEVDNSAALRKYYTYGETLIGFTHGGNEAIANLPVIMLQEAREQSGRTRFHEWHLGHYHHRKEIKYVAVDEKTGIVIRTLSGLTASDEWLYRKGFVGARRGAHGFVFHKEHGLISQLYSPDPYLAEP